MALLCCVFGVMGVKEGIFLACFASSVVEISCFMLNTKWVRSVMGFDGACLIFKDIQ